MTLAPVPARPAAPSHDQARGPARAMVPPLENGDRLTRAEFHRRYEAMPQEVRAELIEGIVYMASPVNVRRHARPHYVFSRWIGRYADHTPGLDESVALDGTVLLDNDNEPQPDLLLWLPPSLGGLASLNDDGYLVGPPTLAIEVAASSAAIDLHRKLDAYRRNGVAEYLVWRTLDEGVDFFRLIDGGYDRVAPDPDDGLLKSAAFPGLWLDADALVARDLPRLLAAADNGCATPDHAAFAARLRDAVAAAATSPEGGSRTKGP